MAGKGWVTRALRGYSSERLAALRSQTCSSQRLAARVFAVVP